MANKITQELCITAEEAIALSAHSTVLEIIRAKDIIETWEPRYPHNPEYDHDCMLAAIYVAGRIQGIREERKRHKKEIK